MGIELDVIAAVVLGGTSLMGGAGSVLMTVVGVLLIGVMNNGLGLLNVPIEMQLIAKFWLGERFVRQSNSERFAERDSQSPHDELIFGLNRKG